MPIDRESTLRQAEKLHRQGRIDLAIAEYVRLVDDQPGDWNAINGLGDLYLHAGDPDRAVVQFVRIADHLFSEGFLPKAAAVYKKALKARPDHEHTLLRLSEIAAAQELLADARAYLRRLWEQRSERGDDRGAAECLVRLGLLPEADAETQTTGARAAKALGDTVRAATLFRAAAEQLRKSDRQAAALDALAQVAALDPSDVALRRRLAAQYVAAGQLDDASRFLDEETAGSDPELLLALGVINLSRRNDDAVRSALTRFIALAPNRWGDVLRLAGDLGRAGEVDRAFRCMEIVVDDSVLRADWEQAVDMLQSFLVHGPYIPALLKLAQVSLDAGRPDIAGGVLDQLAAAHLESGELREARAAAEALLGREPDSDVHAERLRRVLQLMGVDDIEGAVRSVRERTTEPARAAEPPGQPELDATEIDLSDAVDALARVEEGRT